MMNRLNGKVALISGAARGIGAATARLMVEAGAKVAIGDVLDERGRATAQAIAGPGEAAMYLHLDVTSEDEWNAAVAAAVARFGGLDILVNNAGLFLGKGIEEASLDEWHRLSAVNLIGVFLGTKLALPALRESAQRSAYGSAIVNLASVAGLVGSQLDPLYSLTKGGVTLFTKSAALEFARKGYRVRVNSIHPGVIQTDMGDQTFLSRARSLGTNDIEASRRLALSGHPIGRLGTPDDIGKGIVFLASDDAAFMTGGRARGRWRADGAVTRGAAPDADLAGLCLQDHLGVAQARKARFAEDSPPEGDGFEPSVPGTIEPIFVAEGELRDRTGEAKKGCFLCGTDGSNPFPSSRQSVSRPHPLSKVENPGFPRGCA
jgi:3(or 17)beta-hydroxysteroid dehydrogenase